MDKQLHAQKSAEWNYCLGFDIRKLIPATKKPPKQCIPDNFCWEYTGSSHKRPLTWKVCSCYDDFMAWGYIKFHRIDEIQFYDESCSYVWWLCIIFLKRNQCEGQLSFMVIFNEIETHHHGESTFCLREFIIYRSVTWSNLVPIWRKRETNCFQWSYLVCIFREI